jgi:hypothetical protein
VYLICEYVNICCHLFQNILYALLVSSSVKVKVKFSCYRPKQALVDPVVLRLPDFLDF